MEAAQTIRDAVVRVSQFRHAHVADPALGASVHAVKVFQARRFAGTYADLLGGGTYREAARFFLNELYGSQDYTERDAQFARIAGTLQTLFPSQVVETAVALARLHALTEELDHGMGMAWHLLAAEDAPMTEGIRYARSWQAVGQRESREKQLGEVQKMGQELARLTRFPGLRTMLRMMRKPAHAAGLASLQSFLESGFDTFSSMARQRQGVEVFLSLIKERESALITRLFESDPVTCGTELDHLLGQVR